MKLSIAVCDDERDACKQMHRLLQSCEIKYDLEPDITLFTKPAELLASYRQGKRYDLLFLDVEMPEISGIEAARMIRALPDPDVKIIFTSNYPEYMQDSFDVSAYQYLQKPVSTTQLHAQFHRLITELRQTSSNVLLIKHGDVEQVVQLSQILYIESLKGEKNVVRYVCQKEVLVGAGILNELEEKLLAHHFLSPHRGFLVNVHQVHFIRRNEIEMLNGDKIPLSRRREKEFRNYFNRQLLQ